jgi:hypothetical protein
MKRMEKKSVVLDVVINIDESDDEVQYIGTTHEDITGDHVIDAEQLPQQQHPLPPQSHMFSPLQEPRHIALHQLPLPICGSGAMMLRMWVFRLTADSMQN